MGDIDQKLEGLREQLMENLVVAIDNGENLEEIEHQARDLEDGAQKMIPTNFCGGPCIGCLAHAGAAAFVFIVCVQPSLKYSSLICNTWLATVICFSVKAFIDFIAAMYAGCSRNALMVPSCFRCMYRWIDGFCKAGFLGCAAVLTAGYFMYEHTGANWLLILTLMALWVYSGCNLFSREFAVEQQP